MTPEIINIIAQQPLYYDPHTHGDPPEYEPPCEHDFNFATCNLLCGTATCKFCSAARHINTANNTWINTHNPNCLSITNDQPDVIIGNDCSFSFSGCQHTLHLDATFVGFQSPATIAQFLITTQTIVNLAVTPTCVMRMLQICSPTDIANYTDANSTEFNCQCDRQLFDVRHALGDENVWSCHHCQSICTGLAQYRCFTCRVDACQLCVCMDENQ